MHQQFFKCLQYVLSVYHPEWFSSNGGHFPQISGMWLKYMEFNWLHNFYNNYNKTAIHVLHYVEFSYNIMLMGQTAQSTQLYSVQYSSCMVQPLAGCVKFYYPYVHVWLKLQEAELADSSGTLWFQPPHTYLWSHDMLPSL